MKIAISTLTDRIAPVFDTVGGLLLVDCEAGRVLGRSQAALDSPVPEARAGQLTALGVQALLCGAISTPFRLAVEERGIRVVPFLTGRVEEILHAWVFEGLDESRFRMPGCGRGPRRQGGRNGSFNGVCVCPVCGQEAPHTPGTPCKQRLCPKCGTAMARR